MITSLFGQLNKTASAVLFAGMGGACEGIRQATGSSPLVAINHCKHALRLHALNHPDVLHLEEDVFDVVPAVATRGRRLKLLWMSPDCTHFSRAKGAAPRSSGRRGMAMVGIDWARAVRPSIIMLENVPEFLTWGPLDEDGHPIKERAGEDFKAWCAEIESCGYRIEWRILSAADYGAPTSRRRLFLIARCDGKPIVWPEPTHGPRRAKPWRTALECIDWSIPMESIFERKTQLAEATNRRLAHGLVRYVLESKPVIVPVKAESGNHSGLVAAWLTKFYGTSTHGQSIPDPMPTVTSTGNHLGVACAWISSQYGQSVGSSLKSPLPTITAGGMGHHSLVSAFLIKYYGCGVGQRIDAPLDTVTTVDRFGLVTTHIDGQSYVVTDIKMRMLQPRELARAMGFDDSYILEGNKRDQVARVGNAVCPPIAKALVGANV